MSVIASDKRETSRGHDAPTPAEGHDPVSPSAVGHSNTANLAHALEFLEKLIRVRAATHFADSPDEDPPGLAYYDDGSAFGDFIRRRQPKYDEYLVLLLALAPHLRPEFLDRMLKEVLPAEGDFPQIGGRRDLESRTFLPTGETAMFLLAGDDLDRRFEVQQLFTADHWLVRERVLRLEPAPEGAPLLSGRLLLDPDYIELFTLGSVSVPPFGPGFPARAITTELEWHEVVLESRTREQLEELRRWIDHDQTLRHGWSMARKLRPGYRALFHGPPGTGKTLTATLLGKSTGRRVFRIDLSTVVSKYIGETEKSLAGLFDRADKRGWILFFDEADALFGKRSSVKDAHDRYANQEVSYLLQRIEDFDGLVILASNLKANIDEAFLRRFNAVIQFPFPSLADRRAIWRSSLPPNAAIERGEDLLDELARFELSGGNIVNAIQHACLAAIAKGCDTISRTDAMRGVQRELEKEGKIFVVPDRT